MLKSGKKVSVIVPVYNGEATLQRCLDSLLAQTWKNMELVVVNNASSDSTAAICAACPDPRLVYLEEPRRGVSYARNTGLAAAGGDYIMFVDADDFVEPDMLETMLSVEGYDVVYCGLTTQNPDGSNPQAMRIPEGPRSREDILCLLLQAKALSIMFGPCCKLYSRSVISSVCFDENIQVGEDLKFHFDVLQHFDKAFFIDKQFYHYILYPQSDGHAKDSLKKTDMILVWDYILGRIPPKLYPLAVPTYIELLLNTMRYLLRNAPGKSHFAELRMKLRPLAGEILHGPYSWGRKRAALLYLICPFELLRLFRRRKS